MPNVINAIKGFLEEKKEVLERDVFFPFSSSPGVYCNDQPNALDTAVRRCSYTLTLRVLNDSGRMNHGAEVDGVLFFFISQHLLLLYSLYVTEEFV